MSKTLGDQLDSIFSLLPERKAREAKRELLQRFGSDGIAQADELKWAEFEIGGRFLRGGVTSVSELTTRVVTASQEDPDIHDMVRRVVATPPEPGHMEWLPASERICWFVPFLPSRRNTGLVRRMRGISISYPLFQEVLGLFDDSLTGKERRVAFQIIAGFGLREAAAADGVAYETKRAHVKSACEKLNCKSQRELTQKVVGQLTYLYSLSEAEPVDAEVAETFVARFLADDARLIVHRLADGRGIRYLDCGPRDGIPVVLIHGIMFPISLFGIAEHLNRSGIRLIVPIRQGFLESRPVSALFQRDDIVGASIGEIETLLEELGIAPAVIVGNSLGGIVAMRLARHRPDLVAHLVLLSINLTRTAPSERNHAGEFYGGLHSIADQPDLFRFVNWHFKKYYADLKTCREILLRLFGGSPADRDVLEGRCSNVPAYAMFSATYQASIVGIAEDFRLGTQSWQDDFRPLEMPVTFIHGSEDPLTAIAQIEAETADKPNSRIVPIEDGGHFVSVSCARRVWSEISALAAGVGQ